jgi:hypothetical protein
MAYTLTKLDDAIVELHEGLQATLIPVMEENKYLRNELSEVKALLSEIQVNQLPDMKSTILDNQVQTNNKFKLIEKSISENNERSYELINAVDENVSNNRAGINSLTDKSNHDMNSMLKLTKSIETKVDSIISDQQQQPTVHIPSEPVLREPIININNISNATDWAQEPDNMYIGRLNNNLGLPASKWMNPFTVEDWGREECLVKYERYLQHSPDLLSEIGELEGKQLGCYCVPEQCHANILLKVLKQKTAAKIAS